MGCLVTKVPRHGHSSTEGTPFLKDLLWSRTDPPYTVSVFGSCKVMDLDTCQTSVNFLQIRLNDVKRYFSKKL